MKPVKTSLPRSNLWNPSRRVWFQKNEDHKEINDLWDKAMDKTLKMEELDEHERKNAREDVKRRKEDYD